MQEDAGERRRDGDAGDQQAANGGVGASGQTLPQQQGDCGRSCEDTRDRKSDQKQQRATPLRAVSQDRSLTGVVSRELMHHGAGGLDVAREQHCVAQYQGPVNRPAQFGYRGSEFSSLRYCG